MKIKLTAPEAQWAGGISSARTFKIQRVNLPLLAALTPPAHTVQLVDEAFAADDPEAEVDLVGITVLTELAARAYQIADGYRRRGARVVLGGIHPSVLPAEALRHADAVVVGEAEETWPRVVADAAAGKLRKVYRSSGPTELSRLPRPHRHLYPRLEVRGYTPLAVGVESGRGCPFDCEFCTVSQFWGHALRTRPVAQVLSELESIAEPNLFFVDDTLALNKAPARELFEAMIPLKRNWIGQGGVRLAEDVALLRLMRRAGCRGLQIGFESVDERAQAQMTKLHTCRLDPGEAMCRFHGEGIMILGAFVFGFDHETEAVFDRTMEFIMKWRLEGAQVRMLCPFPGTRLYRRLAAEGRLLDVEWWLHGHSSDTLLFRPKRMSPEAFLQGLDRTVRAIYSWHGIADRFFGIRPWRRPPLDWALYGGFNLATRRRYYQSLEAPERLLAQPLIPPPPHPGTMGRAESAAG